MISNLMLPPFMCKFLYYINCFKIELPLMNFAKHFYICIAFNPDINSVRKLL